MDPNFAQHLRQLGAVQPNPHLSHSSIAPGDPSTASSHPSPFAPPTGPDPRKHPALMVLAARRRLQDEADREFMEVGRNGRVGRRFLDVITIRQALMLRDERGLKESEIEKQLGLAPGVVEKLGPKGTVESV